MKKLILTGLVMALAGLCFAGCRATVKKETYEKKVEITREIVIE